MKNDRIHRNLSRMPTPVEDTWEDRVVDFKNSVVSEFKQQPLNMVCMTAFVLIVVAVIFYVLGIYFPTFDPSR
ncbi:MAG: hypothetical protein ACI9H6_000104 [Patiriisocius sp.]|jgi:hypothetical protein